MPEMPRLEVDFNDFADDGRLGALRSSADNPSALALGELVTVWDDDGNTAQGRIVELADRDLVWIEVLRETWRSGLEARSAEHAAAAASLANPTSPAWVLSLTAGSAKSFRVLAAPHFSVGFLSAFMAGGVGIQLAAVQGRAGWPQHLDFAEYYKLRLVTGVAPATAEVGS